MEKRVIHIFFNDNVTKHILIEYSYDKNSLDFNIRLIPHKSVLKRLLNGIKYILNFNNFDMYEPMTVKFKDKHRFINLLNKLQQNYEN